MTAAILETAPALANKRVVAATVAGNAIEFYDFLCFGFFAVYISGAFFPGGDPTADLLKTLAVFWAGFLFRPLGGVVIGRYADRAGRRPAMLLTIALITFGTMGVALTPGYATLGPLAPAILVFFRIVQGFALGGEVGPASVYLVEAAPPGRRGFYASWQIASQGMAGVAAGLVGVGLAATLSKQQLADWGWRVPFLLCLALIPIAVLLRGEMPETLTHTAPSRAHPSVAMQIRYIALGVMLIVGGTVSTYVSSAYMSTFAIATLKLPPISVADSATVGDADRRRVDARIRPAGRMAWRPLWPQDAGAGAARGADRADLAAVRVADGRAGRAIPLGGHHRDQRADRAFGGRWSRHLARASAEGDPRLRLCDLLCAGRDDFRRLDALRRHQAD